MNFPPVLFHPINTITAYKGQITYDTPATEAKAQTPVSQLQWQPLRGPSGPTTSSATDLSSLLLPSPATPSPPGGDAAAAAPGGPAMPAAPDQPSSVTAPGPGPHQ